MLFLQLVTKLQSFCGFEGGRGGRNLAKNGFRVVVDKWPLPKRAFGGYLVPSGEARFDSSLFIKLDEKRALDGNKNCLLMGDFAIMSNEANGLIILGNGFDLGLGLKTGYADFIQYLNKQVLSDNRRDKNPLIERIVKDGSLGGKWVDLEMLLLSYANSRFEFLNFNNLNEVRDELAKFLLEEQRRLVIKKSNPVHFLNKTTATINSVINLNYTNSIDAIMGSSIVIRKGHFVSEIKIHGSLSSNNLILGFDQSAKIHSDYSQFKKSFFENYNPIDFSRLLTSIENVYLYGVSMGESDDFFFNNLFERIEAIGGKKVFISYHGQEGKTRLNGRLDVFLSGRMAQFKLLNQIVLFDTEKAPDEWNW